MKPLTKISRIIAEQMGDNYDACFVNKSEWYYHKGDKGFGFREISQPYHTDYQDAAFATIVYLQGVFADPVVVMALQSVLDEGYDA